MRSIVSATNQIQSMIDNEQSVAFPNRLEVLFRVAKRQVYE
jgi:hypothetical protein